MKRMIIGLLFAALATNAFAYYSPEQGRWLNRDPIGEQGGLNVHAFVANSPPNQIDVLGRWNSKVHFDRTQLWSQWVGFVGAFAGIMAFADNDVDRFFGERSSLPWGELGRHMLVWMNGEDSRDYYYRTEFDTAVAFLRRSNTDPSVTWCVRASEAFGRGLHSRQDRSAHRPYPDGSSWPALIQHPGWWDAWDGSDLTHRGISEEWWRRVNLPPDYFPWIGNDPAQVASQMARKVEVVADSFAALAAFKAEVEKTCYCRQIMLGGQ
jgi:hypothetical protein